MKNTKRYLLILIFLSNCNTFVYKSDWGYQKSPFKDYTHSNYAGKWRKSKNPKQDETKHNIPIIKFTGVARK